MSENRIDRSMLRKTLATTPTDGWVGAFKSLGFDLANDPDRESAQTMDYLGLGETSEGASSYYYVKDRERFIGALTAMYGREEVLAALMDLEET